MSKPINLIKIIKDNPGCYAQIDNDWWGLYRQPPSENPYGDEDGDYDKYEEWEENNRLADSSDDFKPRLGDGGYGSGHCYGGDILQALAVIVGINIESV